MANDATTVLGIRVEGIQDVVQALKLVENRFLELDKKVSKTSKQLDSYDKSVKRSNKSLEEGASTQKKTTKNLDDFNKRLSVAIQKIVSYRIAFGAFSQTIETFQNVTETTIELDNTFGDLRKVLTASEGDFNRLQRSAFSLGKEFGRSALEVSQSFLVFGQQGLSTSEILERTRATLLAVSSSTLTVEQAVESLTAVVNNFTDPMISATDAVDKWAKVAATAPVSAKDLADSVLNVGTTAQQVGFSIDELNGAVAAIAEVTRKSGKNIGNSLKTIFARLRRPEVINQLEELGVRALSTREEFRGMGDVLRSLNSNWEGLSDVQKFNIAVAASGIRQYNAFLALFENFDRFTETTIDSQRAFGFAQRATAAETEKYSRQIQALQTNLEELAIEFGQNGLVDIVVLFNKALSSGADIIKGSGSDIIKFNSAMVALTVAVFAAKGAVALFNAVLSTTQGILSRTIPIITLMAIAGNALILFFNKSEQSSKKFSNAIDDLSQSLRDAAFEQAKLNNKDQEFINSEKLRAANIDLTNTIIALGSISSEIDKLKSNKVDFGDVIQNPDAVVAALQRKDPSIPVNKERNDRREQLEEEKRLLEAQRVAQEALIRTINGDQSVTLEQLRAKDLERIQIDLEKVEDRFRTSLKAVSDFKKGSVDSFKFEGLSGLRTELEDLPEQSFDLSNLTNNSKRELVTLVRGLDLYRKTLKKSREEILKVDKSSDDLGKGEFELTDHSTEALREFSKLRTEIDGIQGSLQRSAVIAELFGQPFDSLTLQAEALKTSFDNAAATNKKFLDNYNSALEEARKAGVDINATLEEGTPILEKLAAAVGEEGNEFEEAYKIAQKLLEAEKDLLDSREQFSIINKEILADLEDVANKLAERPRLIFQSNVELLKTTSELNQQSAQLELISSALTGISRSRLLDTQVLNRQQSIQKQILDNELKKKVAAIDTQLAQTKINQGSLTEEDIRKRNLAVIEAILQREDELFANRQRSIANLVRENAALRDQFSQSLASGLANLPQELTRRKQAEDEIARRRVELEHQLTQARIAGDNEAIQNAELGLQRLKQEAEQIGSFGEDLFFALEGVADNIRSKLAETISDELLNASVGNLTIGEQLADGVLQGSTAGALEIRNKSVEGHQVGGNAAASAILEAHIRGAQLNGEALDIDKIISELNKIDLGNDVKNNIEIGGDSLKSALLSSFQLGSTLLSQSLFGGGAGSSLGSTLGGTFGSIGFEKLFTSSLGDFAGPLGILAGSLFGGFLGSLFDNKQEPVLENNIDALNKNTIAIENNNKLLELQREFINAPTRFVAPQLRGQFSGGIGGGITIQNLNVGGGSQGAQEFIDTIDRAFSSSSRNTGRLTTFGR